MRHTIQPLDDRSLDLNISKMSSVVFCEQPVDASRFLLLAEWIFNGASPDIVHDGTKDALSANLKVVGGQY
jgi:hypothetical protein